MYKRQGFISPPASPTPGPLDPQGLDPARGFISPPAPPTSGLLDSEAPISWTPESGPRTRLYLSASVSDPRPSGPPGTGPREGFHLPASVSNPRPFAAVSVRSLHDAGWTPGRHRLRHQVGRRLELRPHIVCSLRLLLHSCSSCSFLTAFVKVPPWPT